MITPSKFSRLRKITKYFKIAEELKSLRDSYLSSGSADLENIKAFRWYLEAETDAEYIKELDEISDLNLTSEYDHLSLKKVSQRTNRLSQLLTARIHLNTLKIFGRKPHPQTKSPRIHTRAA